MSSEWAELSSEWGELSSECGATCLRACFLCGELHVSRDELSLGRVVCNQYQTGSWINTVSGQLGQVNLACLFCFYFSKVLDRFIIVNYVESINNRGILKFGVF